MKVGFGCDHTAIELKKELMEYMESKGYECVDYGAYDAAKRVDYPDQGLKVAEAIKAGEVEKVCFSAGQESAFPWRPIKCRESVRLCAASLIQP